MKTERQHSAGGVVVRDSEVLLISTQAGRWQLPKGHIEVGETAGEAALREIREETGVTARLIALLPKISYSFTQDGYHIRKEVDYFLLQYVKGNADEFDPSEVSGTAWFSWDDGILKLSFDNERDVVREARKVADGLQV